MPVAELAHRIKPDTVLILVDKTTDAAVVTYGLQNREMGSAMKILFADPSLVVCICRSDHSHFECQVTSQGTGAAGEVSETVYKTFSQPELARRYAARVGNADMDQLLADGGGGLADQALLSKLAALADPNLDQVTRSQYDRCGRVIRQIDGENGFTENVYNAFGDKRTLSTQCLDRYMDANMRARIARVEKSLPPRQAIETFLTEIVERSLESRLGCLLANAALEVAPHDPQIAAVVADRMGELEAFFRRCVIAGQRDGSISPGVDPADAGRLLLTTVMGLRVLARGFPNRAVLEGAARQALSVLGKPIRRRKPSVRSQITKGEPR